MAWQTSMGTTTRRCAGVFAVASLFAISAPALAENEQQQLVNQAEATLNNFLRDPDMGWLQRNIGRAKGVLIAPAIVKAGWIFGGSGGRAVLFAHNFQNGRWSGPAFYNVGAASIGFQAGVSLSETVTLVMTDKGMNNLLSSSAKLGGDASIAAGPIGAGAAADILSDYVAFSRSKGIYGGLNLEGSIVAVADDWNRVYYGSGLLPSDILVRGVAHNQQADRIVAELGRASSGQRTSMQ